MRTQLETIKTLFEQVRGLGIAMQLPNDNHTKVSENITVYFAEGQNVTNIAFGRGNEQVEIMKYSTKDTYLKVSLGIDSTDEQLDKLIEIIQNEFKQIKIDYLESELFALKNSDIVVLERGEVVA